MTATSGRRDRVAVIGGGFGGIAAAVTLKRAGLTNFVVFEQSPSVGGVWWDNRYPGAEVDTASHIYSFSFQRYAWSRSHADRRELLAYMEHTIDRWDVRRFFRLGTRVLRLEWDDRAAEWVVETSAGSERFNYVISAVGILNVPRFPSWPGLDTFAGQVFHTSRWDETCELDGKRVGLVGTGSTGVQLASRVAERAGRLTIFQREPGWVQPKTIRTYTDRERRRLARPLRYRIERWRAFREIARNKDAFVDGSASNLAAAEACRAYIREAFKDRPDLEKLVTPSYPFGGKRPVRDSNFYPTLLRDNVELVPAAVESVIENGVVDGQGEAHDLDVLILATGFQPAKMLSQIDVVGRRGRSLHAEWGDEPMAFLGSTVPGFPNFFMLYGPNSNGAVILFLLEQQAKFAVRSIKQVLRSRAIAIETRPYFHQKYNEWLQKGLAATTWQLANNYFKSPTGRIVTQWPHSAELFWVLVLFLRRISSRLVRRRASALGDNGPA